MNSCSRHITETKKAAMLKKGRLAYNEECGRSCSQTNVGFNSGPTTQYWEWPRRSYCTSLSLNFLMSRKYINLTALQGFEEDDTWAQEGQGTWPGTRQVLVTSKLTWLLRCYSQKGPYNTRDGTNGNSKTFKLPYNDLYVWSSHWFLATTPRLWFKIWKKQMVCKLFNNKHKDGWRNVSEREDVTKESF